MLRVALLCLALLAGLVPSGVVRADGEERQEELPVPEANFAGTVVPRPCTAQEGNPYEAEQYHQVEGWSPEGGRYPGDCQRLRFSFGPIHVKPGQNDVLIEPVTIEKPAYDGYAVRFRPELVYADGTVPSMHDIHLHHAVWLNIFGNYGNGQPFFAAGEEKTIINLPGSADSEEPSFGMPVKATDTWQILYMIHNEQIEPTEVFLVYEVDFVPEEAADELNMQPVYPVWLDVRPSIYPVFNAQRGPEFGHTDENTGRRVCTWPAEDCARFDPWGDVTPHQGGSRPPEVNGECGASEPANCVELPRAGGSHGRLRDFQGGTLVHVGGHLHPGGLTVDIDLERGPEESTRIFTSEAVYWSHEEPHTDRTGPPTSWDMAMTVQSLPEWGIEVEPGDVLRINATTDITEQAVYEGMGIAIAWLSPDPQLGVNPFQADHDTGSDCGGLQASPPQVCERGEVSHGHLAEAEGYGGEGETDFADGLDELDELDVQEIAIGGFVYAPGNMGSVQGTGIPTVELGEDLRFVNLDAAANVYHTITSCKYPCNGAHGTAYPVANGESRSESGSESESGDPVDFDSGELGYGARLGGDDLGPAKNEADWTLKVRPDGEVGEYEGFEPGVYTYFCRVHPWMRGTFKVKEKTS